MRSTRPRATVAGSSSSGSRSAPTSPRASSRPTRPRADARARPGHHPARQAAGGGERFQGGGRRRRLPGRGAPRRPGPPTPDLAGEARAARHADREPLAAPAHRAEGQADRFSGGARGGRRRAGRRVRDAVRHSAGATRAQRGVRHQAEPARGLPPQRHTDQAERRRSRGCRWEGHRIEPRPTGEGRVARQPGGRPGAGPQRDLSRCVVPHLRAARRGHAVAHGRHGPLEAVVRAAVHHRSLVRVGRARDRRARLAAGGAARRPAAEDAHRARRRHRAAPRRRAPAERRADALPPGLRRRRRSGWRSSISTATGARSTRRCARCCTTPRPTFWAPRARSSRIPTTSARTWSRSMP